MRRRDAVSMSRGACREHWLISLSGARRLLWAVVGERRGTNLGITLEEAIPVPLPVHHNRTDYSDLNKAT